MGLFTRKKIVDLTEGYSQRKPSHSETQSSEATSSALSESSDSSSLAEQETTPRVLGPDEKRRRLARRLKDMTDKLEELSNSIYLLQQRVEVLEKKTGVGREE